MRIALDTEFIDTPTCSALISLALAAENGTTLYLEFDYPKHQLTPWLEANVVPHLVGGSPVLDGATQITKFLYNAWESGPLEIWAYYGTYDWYHFCRLFGGLFHVPRIFPMRFREFAEYTSHVPDLYGPAHHALNDARSLLAAVMKRRP